MLSLRRHINLDGSTTRFRGHKLETPLRYIGRAEHLLPAAYATALTIHAYAYNPREAFAVAAYSLAGTAGSVAYIALLNKLRVALHFQPYLEKCFDRKPDRHTQPTKPDNIKKAANIRTESNIISTTMLFTFGLFNHALYKGTEDSLPFMGFATLLIGCAAHEATRAYMFNQVVKNQWAILDQPPPKPVKAAKTVAVPFGTPGMG